jgi:hypothetical protein
MICQILAGLPFPTKSGILAGLPFLLKLKVFPDLEILSKPGFIPFGRLAVWNEICRLWG